jgi:glycosyltransferase involved in cell wall biosynthesis
MIQELILLIPSLVTLLLVAWNVLAWPKFKADDRAYPRSVSVLIPARDEEVNIAACLDTVLNQDETVAEILVYDDHSIDATSEIVQRYASQHERVRLIAAKELPAGWCGKNFACAQLASEASSEWLLFLDADARLARGGVARMLGEARQRNAMMMSAWPALNVVSFWEKTLMPMLNFVVFTLFPAPLSLARDDKTLGLAHGACILAERASYFVVGGHAAVRDQIFEDQRLARLWRAKGKRGLCLDGQEIVSVRMYNSLGEIWSGFEKNFFPAFRRELSFWLFIALHATIFLAPFVLFVWTRLWGIWVAALFVLTMRALLAFRFGHPLWPVLLHPLAELILICVGLSSWWRCKSGRGVEWKGRQYHAGVE